MAVLAGAALVATGCSDGGGAAMPPQSTEGPSLLSLAVYGPAPVITAYTAVAAQFSAENPNTSVSVEPYADATQAQAAIQKQIAAGTPPDVFLTPVASLPQLEEGNVIQEVGGLLLDRDVDFGDGYQRYALEAFSSEQRLQCMPADSSPMVVYYNTDLVNLEDLNSDLEQEVTQESGWSFEQFEEAARKPRADDARGLYVEPSLNQLAPFIYSGGGKLLDNAEEPTMLALSDGSTKDALAEVLPLFRDPVVNFSQQEVDQRSALKRFKRGNLAMMLGYRSLVPELRSAKSLSFDVMPLPKVGSPATVGETSGLCLSASTTQLEEAADFLEYLVSDAAMSQLAATGFVVPSNNDTAHSDAFLQPDLQPEHATVFTDQIRFIRALPTMPAWPELVQDTVPQIAELLYDPLIQSVEDRLRAIDESSKRYFGSGDPVTPTSDPTN